MGNLINENILIIDLSKNETSEEYLEEEFIKEHIGGAATNIALYHQYEDDDPIIIGTGILTGTLAPGGSLAVITAKSPRTGEICHAPVNLCIGAELKYSGYDYVVIKGVAEKPVYLWIHDAIADINDAEHLWEKNAWETTDTLRNDLGEALIQNLTIGEMGEKESDLAQVISNYWSSGDRWGFGALFGKKKLKSIAIRGMGLFDMEDEKGFLNLCLELLNESKNSQMAGKQGIIDIGNELDADLKEWLDPVLHRNSACFNMPYPGNTFLKNGEDPKILKETDVEEPGVLVTDIFEILGFKELGLTSKDTVQVLMECLKTGIDPVAAAQICINKEMKSVNEIIASLGNFKGPVNTTGKTAFSPCCPEKSVFNKFDNENDTQDWWVRRQKIAYVFGIHQTYSIMSPFLSEEKLLELVNIGTGLDISQEDVETVIAKL
ncbi:MAG: hypothetical protein HF978_13435 [Desulfobacteraceae bacterium]|nr:hypothetical protein [Desulfobacteraceae bacterium]MBC2756545.1 hypothetical protein [Desulfobacteraceae bacterium]